MADMENFYYDLIINKKTNLYLITVLPNKDYDIGYVKVRSHNVKPNYL